MITIVERLLSGIVCLSILVVIVAQIDMPNNPARPIMQLILDLWSGSL